ncbi:efflux RND transporter periplasmic adaptor subunit [Achromobacter aegrifaciens]|uniref:efflux RND transporter periplasmic adaptor subunit n=1 Tax=Achromobacter TaxID=222 RepID=UPI0008B6AEFC|nr:MULTISPECIES: efflux RND transporter periplasmic adaptor subunit [Achromobacter]MDQ1758222.1 efflux RND transporter periplasmic adaptor subunit [Achromobacter aegrifaciens]OFL45881.1 efflux transporter periplasmic adaptor subunit [Achromobacter xylosoxidans]
MKNVSNTAHRRARLCLVAGLFLCSSALAADRSASFTVSDEQVAALGITMVPLSSAAPKVQAAYPAKVVMPPNADQVVSSPVTGLLTEILVLPGQAVDEGASLLNIASSEYGQLQLDLIQTAARASLARQNAQRERSLYAEGIIAQRRVQEAGAALSEAEAALRQAQAALRLAGMSDAELERLAKTATPQFTLTVRAGRKGVINAISARPGQRVDSTSGLVEISSTESLWLEIQVPAKELVTWVEGSLVTVPGREVSARLLSSTATVDVGSQTVTVRAAVDQSATPLRPGEILSAELASADGPKGWSIPLSGVAHDGKQAYVFIRSKDGFEARPVQLIASAGTVARVSGDLNEGEQVATAGVVALKGAWIKNGEKE